MRLSVFTLLVLVLAPGLLLALALDQAPSFELWLLRGFCWSVVVLGLVVAAVQGLTGAPLVGSAFCLVTLACTLAAGLFAAHLLGSTHVVGRASEKIPGWLFAVVYGALWPLALAFMNGAVKPFIYFQF